MTAAVLHRPGSELTLGMIYSKYVSYGLRLNKLTVTNRIIYFILLPFYFRPMPWTLDDEIIPNQGPGEGGGGWKGMELHKTKVATGG